jgi:hypothetical protein
MRDNNCNLCDESSLHIGQSGTYGAVVVAKVGEKYSGWIATLSPRTGGNPSSDFSIQLMTLPHLTHFAEIGKNIELAKNYGIIFSKVGAAMRKLLEEEVPGFTDPSSTRENSVSIATYGKCTTWQEKKEHLHIKIYPFRGKLGQPAPVDSSFGRKEIQKEESGEEFVKFNPVNKVSLPAKRFTYLTNRLIKLLN